MRAVLSRLEILISVISVLRGFDGVVWRKLPIKVGLLLWDSRPAFFVQGARTTRLLCILQTMHSHLDTDLHSHQLVSWPDRCKSHFLFKGVIDKRVVVKHLRHCLWQAMATTVLPILLGGLIRGLDGMELWGVPASTNMWWTIRGGYKIRSWE